MVLPRLGIHGALNWFYISHQVIVHGIQTLEWALGAGFPYHSGGSCSFTELCSRFLTVIPVFISCSQEPQAALEPCIWPSVGTGSFPQGNGNPQSCQNGVVPSRPQKRPRAISLDLLSLAESLGIRRRWNAWVAKVLSIFLHLRS